MAPPREDLTFAVEEWLADDSRRVEVLARASDYRVAVAAYWAAIEVRPRARIVLRQKARQLAARAATR